MVSWLRRSFIVIDTESTGLSFEKDRIVEASVAVFLNSQYVHGFSWLSSVERKSAPEAAAVHGISDEYRWEHGIKPRVIAERLLSMICKMRDAHMPVMAFNAPFDFSMMRGEFVRAGLGFNPENLSVVDPLVIDRHYQKHIPVFTKPWMRLGQMAARYGVAQPTHRALDDAICAGYVAIAQSLHHPAIRNMPLPELHRNQVKWYDEWARKFQSFATKKGFTFNIPEWPLGSPVAIYDRDATNP